MGLHDEDNVIYVQSVSGLACVLPYWKRHKLRLLAKKRVLEETEIPAVSKTFASQSQKNVSSFVADTFSAKKPTDASTSSYLIYSRTPASSDLSETSLLENILIPHSLKVTVSDDFPNDQKWIVLDSLIRLFRLISTDKVMNTMI